MSSPVADLEAGLNAMQALKPPGVSGSKIQSLTTLCVENVQSEDVLIQKIFTHFKKAPGTHKLGVLYVVDSVTRRWVDHAKQQGQQINSSAPHGTYAAGVHRVTELLPVLMNDILQNAPAEQKEKIKKLVDIWEKGQTFPTSLIESFKQKLNAPSVKEESTTPIGSPPPGPGLPGLTGNKAPTTEAPNAIMEALANIARQNITSASNSNPIPAPANLYNLPGVQPVVAPPAAPTPTLGQNHAASSTPYQAAAPPVNAPGLPFQFSQLGQTPAQPPITPVQASAPAQAFPGIVAPGAPPAPPVAGMDPHVQQQVMLIQLLASQGVPYDKIPAIVASMQSSAGATAAPAAPVPPPGQSPYTATGWGQDAYRPGDSGGRPDYSQVRSPNRFADRSRSRSPPRHWDSPRGRGDRDYGVYGRDSPGPGRGRTQDYRQRSPAGRRGHSPTPPHDYPQPPATKWVDYDRSIPSGHIKVLSRTLFVGGVTCPESELRSVFNRHGRVQTCIVNKDKRHAFVKMITRRDAVAAKEAMENGPFRTRWGVGFGPRDCSDYQTGISVIPINKLTEADRKWMLTAEFGGSGGRPIETGLVVEEPDIEIGAGVSSKAISRRMQTDRGGRNGPKSSRGPSGEDENDLTRWRRNRDSRRDDRRDDKGFANNNTTTTQPAMPEFPFGISAGPNGMPVFPPGFAFPPPDQSNSHA
ncbi:hypothetical protein DL766_003416 [Monosporascus sp. MC13-8B]|uniref:CID domain-containing protein n=1 Tax=Monosporascus cannonballus TaxID=155416 RepID=A0ABY0HG83_9PEZI|nr:hypothetical protein DL763_007398 [Monosporascus cannonballus]RYO92758.1 hypothetical protein DL762_001464 [Monosporascus cannonballus]RYP33496.1 hypothetical protein DL766_003416 [Monosporascus sp. MC13-8B]